MKNQNGIVIFVPRPLLPLMVEKKYTVSELLEAKKIRLKDNSTNKIYSLQIINKTATVTGGILGTESITLGAKETKSIFIEMAQKKPFAFEYEKAEIEIDDYEIEIVKT